jgi:hypothetical protein
MFADSVNATLAGERRTQTDVVVDVESSVTTTLLTLSHCDSTGVQNSGRMLALRYEMSYQHESQIDADLIAELLSFTSADTVTISGESNTGAGGELIMKVSALTQQCYSLGIAQKFEDWVLMSSMYGRGIGIEKRVCEDSDVWKSDHGECSSYAPSSHKNYGYCETDIGTAAVQGSVPYPRSFLSTFLLSSFSRRSLLSRTHCSYAQR